VNAWRAIGYGYKNLLLFVNGSGKKDAFIQVDYFTQVLEYLPFILEAFVLVTHFLDFLWSLYLWRMEIQLMVTNQQSIAVLDIE